MTTKNPNAAFVGIDVAFAKKKRLPVCVASWINNRLVPLPLTDRHAPPPPRGSGNVGTLEPLTIAKFAADTAAYLRAVEKHYEVSIRCVAIDAPSDPKAPGSDRRMAERALDARGISCFTTPSAAEFEVIKQKARAHLLSGGEESRLPHANQLWMLVGFALFERLRLDWDCLEVFPHATACALGAQATHKSSPLGVEAQLRAASQFTGWPKPFEVQSLRRVVCGPTHDGLDAYLSAWVAALEPHQIEALGAPAADAIWVPSASWLSKGRVVGELEE